MIFNRYTTYRPGLFARLLPSGRWKLRLGISRPLVVLRMDRGDLPFRYVGKHRRALLKDVLALKTRLDTRHAAMDALAEDTENLIQTHGL